MRNPYAPVGSEDTRDNKPPTEIELEAATQVNDILNMAKAEVEEDEVCEAHGDSNCVQCNLIIAAVETYQCNGCENWFRMENYSSGTAYYHSDFIQCNQDDCSAYTESRGEAENVWYCDDGCFHHDQGTCPADVSDRNQVPRQTMYECPDCNDLHETDYEARTCCN